MTKPTAVQSGKGHCLEDDDFYAYLTRSPGTKAAEGVEAHLAACGRCRHELAELVRMLYPEGPNVMEPEPSEREINETLSLIQQTARTGTGGQSRRAQWYRWGAVAAAAVVAIGLSSAGILLLYERNRSQAYYDQARAALEEVYAPQSPSDLRLDLPFSSAASQRAASADDSLGNAERSFNRALGVRDGMREAMLGLGYIDLRKGRFAKAQEAFDAVLGARAGDPQALLGRGVSRFEEGVAATDPLLRDARLRGALDDFDGVLKLRPASIEASFDRIRTLYELGRHKEALHEIDAYLARDAGSIWAVRLQNLRTRMLMSRSQSIDLEIHRAARARDAPALEALARVVPHTILPALRSLVIDSIAFEDQPPTSDKPTSADLEWAARVLSAAHSGITGEISGNRLLAFYSGLTPRQRKTKKDLDVRLEGLIAAYARGDMEAGLRDSEPLIRGFESLGDYWELVRLHQLRGACLTLGRDDFSGATAEHTRMLRAGELSADSDLMARSLSALGSSYLRQNRYDDALDSFSRLKELAQAHRMENWITYGSAQLGSIYLRLNQLEDSLREHSISLAAAYRLMDPNVILSSMENLSIIMERMGRYPEAARFSAESWKQLEAFTEAGLLQPGSEMQYRQLGMLYRRGLLALRMKKPASAEVYFNQALDLPHKGMQQQVAYNRLGLAQAFFEEGRLREADEQASAVLKGLAGNDEPDVAWQAHSLRGFLQARAGSKREALLSFQRAQAILDEMRRNISSPDLRQSFFTRRFDPAREAVSLLRDLNEDPKPALEQVDRAKGVTLREYLDTSSTRPNSKVTTPFWAPERGIAAALPAGTVTLEYFLSSDRVLAFVSGANGVKGIDLSVQPSDLESRVTDYRESIRRNDASSFDLQSRRLYKDLVDPVMLEIERQPVETLVILPDGPLHLLPFGCLTDSEGRFLLEKYTLAYAPSRSILRYCIARNKTSRLTTRSAVLLLDGRASLSGASHELAHLASIFAGSSRLVSSDDLPSSGSMMPQCDILHFAGHADIHRGRPRLVFNARRGEIFLESSAIEKWDLQNVRLVSLLGCNTGIGPLFDGETPWGLVPAFLKAGAPTLLISLLPIDDVCTENLSAKFYGLLTGTSVSKAAALRQAQLSLLRALGNQGRIHPGSWAPFVLVGDPR